MKIRAVVQSLLFVLFVMCVGAAPAFAQTRSAVTTSNVNMRQGPGTNYAVAQVLRSGESVNIVRCTGNWCLVQFRGNRGWISSSLLREGGAGPIGRPSGPNINLNINIGGGRPGVGTPANRACFYSNVNFRGSSFCALPGERRANLASWNNRISSIAIQGRSIRVEVCTERNFRNCSSFRSDVPVLNRMLQQNISSLIVR
ncbi:MAG TPA: SH3 domain-containing protein [Devosiaceae bacterium]